MKKPILTGKKFIGKIFKQKLFLDIKQNVISNETNLKFVKV